MLELVNLSNYQTDLDLIENNAEVLARFLRQHQLAGLEFMLCAPWDETVHRREWIHGSHLHFWPSWLDFWRGDQNEMLRQYRSAEQISQFFGGLTREQWLARYQINIRDSVATGAKYLVLHVCHNRSEEIYDWNFSATSREVVQAACEWINQLVPFIPTDRELLLENLWWPGLTLLDNDLTAYLLNSIQHPQVGLMLDTGHLMNTNQQLQNESAAVEYILRKIEQMGPLRDRIRGVHLHCSLSGDYVKRTSGVDRASRDVLQDFYHVLQIDQHLPFQTSAARRILDCVAPQWLVHEFVQKSADDWSDKVAGQRAALGLAGASHE